MSATTIQVLVAEALRLNDLADAIDGPREELAKLRLELAEAESQTGAEIEAWVEASINGADAGPMPLPPPDLVARRTAIAKLESADRASAQARELLVQKKADVSRRINEAHAAARRSAFESGVSDAVADAQIMNDHLAKATERLTRILGVHNFLKSEADAGSRGGDPIADMIFRMLQARFPDLPAATRLLPWTDAGADAARRDAQQRFELRLAELVNPNPEESTSTAAAAE